MQSSCEKAQGRNTNQLATALNKSAFRGGAALSSQDKTFLTDVKRAYAAFDGRLSAAFREVRQQGMVVIAFSPSSFRGTRSVSQSQPVDVAVNCFLAHPQLCPFLDHSIADLLGRPSIFDPFDHALAQLGVFGQLAITCVTVGRH